MTHLNRKQGGFVKSNNISVNVNCYYPEEEKITNNAMSNQASLYNPLHPAVGQ